MKRILMTLAVAAAFGLYAGATPAQEASNLRELLQQVEQGRVQDSQENRRREQEFQRRQAEQQQLLNQARNERTALERRSEELEQLFASNKDRLAEETAELDRRLGALKELFGVLQQVAGDAQTTFNNSLTSIRYPDRERFLVQLGNKMASTTSLASIEDIERLWFELQREMTASGQVVELEHPVLLADGAEETIPIGIVGIFNVVGENMYLAYNPDTGNVSELPRQPDAARFVGSTEDLIEAEPGEGFVAFGLDPTRGGVLATLVDKPNVIERVQQGSFVGYGIIALGVAGLLIAIWIGFSLLMASRKVTSQLKASSPSQNNPLGRVLSVYEENRNVDTETLELKLSEAVLKETPKLNRGLLLIKVISVVAPLAGLLGTVTGMIKTFEVITLYGAGDPKLMAGGISQALVTTVLGLLVAIPMVLLHTLLAGRSRRIINILQEQSAGIIAEHSEAQHGSTGS